MTRLFAIESFVWGAAALCGPLIGGIFADAGLWRGVFWAFAAQGGLLSLAATAWMPKATVTKALQPSGWSVVALLMLFAATILIAQAGVMPALCADCGKVQHGVVDVLV